MGIDQTIFSGEGDSLLLREAGLNKKVDRQFGFLGP